MVFSTWRSCRDENFLPLHSSGGGCGIGGDGGADKIFAVFFDGVLLSQKTHGLLLASVLCRTLHPFGV